MRLSERKLLKFRVSDHVRKDDSFFCQLANFQSGENGKKIALFPFLVRHFLGFGVEGTVRQTLRIFEIL